MDHSRSPVTVFLALIGALITITASGCKPQEQVSIKEEVADKRALIDKIDVLIRQYVDADVSQARKCLLNAIDLLEVGHALQPVERALFMWIEYARLTVLEDSVGSPLLAAGNLLKAQYWQMRHLELSGMGTHEAFEKVRGFDIAACRAMVDRLDRGFHAGQPAKFRETKPSSQ